ncbi:Intraflagellar transport protein 46-like [Papilio machaon]|uniref:Intraflagellar transport protein 46 homolog n=1 Tax=Papilio machaon TaxID=76193 RepID=A0A194RHR3_PAPMA|nr:Intraflagellar transport protein 46-like [Papilio machaon]
MFTKASRKHVGPGCATLCQESGIIPAEVKRLGSASQRAAAGRSCPALEVVMATNDKHCQTQPGGEKANVIYGEDAVMFDESVVVEGQEVDSSGSSEEGAVRAAMSRFQPPARHTARHDFHSDSDSDSEPGAGDLPARLPHHQSPQRRAKTPEKREAGGGDRPRPGPQRRRDTSHSDSDSGEDVAVRDMPGRALPVEGAYDPKNFQDLKVPPDMENLFQYIMKYTPQKIELEGRLRAFVPECAPAVGDCYALLKLSTPPAAPLGTPSAPPLSDRLLEHIDNLGAALLDEPAAAQSEPALLQLRLRALARSAGGKTTCARVQRCVLQLTRKISEAERNPAAIERWIRDVGELHAGRPPPALLYTWSPDGGVAGERGGGAGGGSAGGGAAVLAGVPGAGLQCSLAQYAALACAVLDVPVSGRGLRALLQALHLLFALYSAVKSSQLYAQRQREADEDSAAHT